MSFQHNGTLMAWNKKFPYYESVDSIKFAILECRPPHRKDFQSALYVIQFHTFKLNILYLTQSTINSYDYVAEMLFRLAQKGLNTQRKGISVFSDRHPKRSVAQKINSLTRKNVALTMIFWKGIIISI